MKIYLKAFVLNLGKKHKEIAGSSFIPTRLRKIEKEMKEKTISAVDVMVRLRDEEKFRKFFSDGDWKMIEKEVGKMLK